MRRALAQALPLTWFWGIAAALYEAIRRVWLISEEEQECQFVVAVDEALHSVAIGRAATEAGRCYAERITKQPVHQPLFRSQVITTYGYRCAICRLEYVSIVDAAYILRDGNPRGDPVVENCLASARFTMPHSTSTSSACAPID